MKKMEVKSIGVFSAFKATLYVSVIPLGIFVLMGMVLTVIGSVMGEKTMIFGGVAYLILPIVMLAIYGVLSMLVALLYNGLAGKFGGLEITMAEKDVLPIPVETAVTANEDDRQEVVRL